MSRYSVRAFRFLCYGALEVALVIAATTMVVCFFRAPVAVAATPQTDGATISTTSGTPPLTLTLKVAPRPGTPGTLLLTSHLEGDSSGGDRSITFFVVTTEFGQGQDVPIGTATIAAHGAASISYKPTWSGKEQFVAKLSANPPGAPTPMATSYYRVTVSAPGPLDATANPARPLAFIGHIFLGMVLTILVLIWLGLITMLVVVARRMPRLAGGGIERRDK